MGLTQHGHPYIVMVILNSSKQEICLPRSINSAEYWSCLENFGVITFLSKLKWFVKPYFVLEEGTPPSLRKVLTILKYPVYSESGA